MTIGQGDEKSRSTFMKLVRDHVPQLITSSGAIVAYRHVSGDEFRDSLVEKLIEECKEFKESGDMEELADVLEVMRALVAHMGLNWDQLEERREEKVRERSAFREQWFLEYVDHKVG